MEEQLTLPEMRRGSLYRNMAKGRTERYIGSVSHIRPMMDYHKKEQEAAMLRDIRIANADEVNEYIDETNKNFAASAVNISRP
jgi:2-phosphoglycerate kinase